MLSLPKKEDEKLDRKMVLIPPIAMSDFKSNRAFTPSNTQHLYPYRYTLPPPLVMPGEPRTLWCLVGDHVPFDVTVYDGNKATHLKEAIKERNKKVFGDEDASSLVLWQVRIFYRPA
jgi:Crinkler effector protein N-terminal domain